MKTKKFSGDRLSALCSSVLSNPLYFSYFLFFSPYLLSLLAFLSPLFITTALLAGISGLVLEDLNLPLRFDGVGGENDEDGDELKWVEEFEVYKIVFGPAGEYPDGEFSDHGSFAGGLEENSVEFSGEKTEEKVLGVLVSDDRDFPAKCDGFTREKAEVKVLGVLVSDDGDFPAKCDEFTGEKTEEKVLGVLFSDDGDFPAKCDEFTGEKTDEKVSGVLFSDDGDFPAKCDKFTGERPGNEKRSESTPSSINGGNRSQQKPLIKASSRKRGEAQWSSNNGGNLTKKHDDYAKPAISPSLSDLGSSARKEKEWRRTLACMLFEERHNSGGGGGGEGMDKLWEVYEKTEHSNGGLVDYEDDDEEEEGGNGELCCLQALKLSAGKMNFGMGKSGVLKISKAFKGIGGGWLGRRRHQVHHHHHGGDSKKGSKF